MSLDDLPDWLAGGRDVVVKAREDDGRAASCVVAQARLAERGFPCARPLTPAVGVGALAVHAEEYRPGGELLQGDSPEVAVRYAAVSARLMAERRAEPPLVGGKPVAGGAQCPLGGAARRSPGVM